MPPYLCESHDKKTCVRGSWHNDEWFICRRLRCGNVCYHMVLRFVLLFVFELERCARSRRIDVREMASYFSMRPYLQRFSVRWQTRVLARTEQHREHSTRITTQTIIMNASDHDTQTNITMNANNTHTKSTYADTSLRINSNRVWPVCDIGYRHLNVCGRLLLALLGALILDLPLACFWRSLFRMLVASKPALSHSWRGMISSALAMALISSCSLPAIVRE